MAKKLTTEEYKKELLALFAEYDKKFAKIEKETQIIQKKAQQLLDRYHASQIRSKISSLK